jgi:uncharacterized protein (DUF1697 family)
VSSCYVALLRGINVGKNSRVGMADLRELVAGLGYTDVVTILQSGNLVFRSEHPVDASGTAALEAAILERTGVASRVQVLAESGFRAIAANNPLGEFAEIDASRSVITFLGEQVSSADIDALDRPSDETLLPERLVLTDRAIYQWCPDGILESKLTARFWRQVGTAATARNVRTVARILAALDAG